MISVDPAAWGYAIGFEEFRDTLVNLWNGWKPPGWQEPLALDEFLLRARTHYLPFVDCVNAKLALPGPALYGKEELPDYVVGYSLMNARKDGKAKVKPYQK
jgi:hypothetical protein